MKLSVIFYCAQNKAVTLIGRRGEGDQRENSDEGLHSLQGREKLGTCWVRMAL
jgi:hypothetical protein